MAYLEESAITLLGSATGLDMNDGTKHPIFTVPVGKTAIVAVVVVRNASISLDTASYGVGYNANADDVVASAVHAELTGATLYTILQAAAGAIIGAAGDVFGLKCSILQGAAATADCEVFGYLI